MKSLLGKALLVVWAVVCLLGIATLAVSHTAALPGTDAGERLVRAALALRSDASRPFLVHVISADCSCTNRLVKHILERGPFPEAGEVILFIGSDNAKRAAAERAGFRFAELAPQEFAKRFALEAAPVLLAFDTKGQLRYAGGYYERAAALFPQDEKLQAKLAQGATPEPLPVYGCAVSRKLRDAVDPLGIVYGKS
jgi:hypothetical protein